MTNTSLDLGHIKISTGSFDELLNRIVVDIQNGRKAYCIPVHMTKYVMSKKDAKLAKVIRDADYITADGVPIVWLSRRLGLDKVDRIPGILLAESCLELAPEKNWRIFVLGATQDELELCISAMQKKYKGINIVGSRNGYFKDEQVDSVIKEINDSSPDILLLGLGLPQKEYFIHDHWDEIDCRFCMTVGGSLDIWAASKPRAPDIVQYLGFEGIYRIFGDIGRRDSRRFFIVMKNLGGFVKDLVFAPSPGSSK